MTHTDAARLSVPSPHQLTNALRFGLVGAGGVAVNLVALHLLYGVAGLPILWASCAAVELAIVHNYLLNDRWTFRRPRTSWRRFVRFNGSALVTLLVNVATVWALVSAGVGYMAANLVGIAFGAALNFGLSSMWVWRGDAR